MGKGRGSRLISKRESILTPINKESTLFFSRFHFHLFYEYKGSSLYQILTYARAISFEFLGQLDKTFRCQASVLSLAGMHNIFSILGLPLDTI